MQDIRIMNAAGECKLLHKVQELARAAVTDITVGSVTVLPRSGNEGNVFWTGPDGTSLNSLGLPNPGMDYYRTHLPDMAKIAHVAGKHLRVSVAGFTPQEYAELSRAAFECGADEVEFNFSCPNIWGEVGQKPIVSFVPDLITHILLLRLSTSPETAYFDRFDRVSVKLSPYSDPMQLAEVAAVIARSSTSAVVCSNTFPNGLAFDDNGKPAINSPQVPDGLAGVAGSAMKLIALGQVRQFRNLLPEYISVIGAGGISTGRDVLNYLRAGASAVQVGTTYFNRGARVFSDILQEYAELIEQDSASV